MFPCQIALDDLKKTVIFVEKVLHKNRNNSETQTQTQTHKQLNQSTSIDQGKLINIQKQNKKTDKKNISCSTSL